MHVIPPEERCYTGVKPSIVKIAYNVTETSVKIACNIAKAEKSAKEDDFIRLSEFAVSEI